MPNSSLSTLFKTTRKARGLSLADVARKAGYLNLNKGTRKFLQIERGEVAFPPVSLLEQFGKALELADEDIMLALSEDFTQLDKPVEPQAIIRAMPAVYLTLKLPKGVTQEEAKRLAKEHSVKSGRYVCVVLSCIRGFYAQPDGISFESYGLPNSMIGGFLDILKSWSRDENALASLKRLRKIKIEKGEG